MTLKQQILYELNERNNLVQAEIKKCEDEAKKILLTFHSFSGSEQQAISSRYTALNERKDLLIRENAWVSEMLSKYK